MPDAVLYVPASHFLHDSDVSDPEAVLYMPFKQKTQVVSLTLSLPVEYLPVAHKIHFSESGAPRLEDHVPPTHWSHVLLLFWMVLGL